MKEFFENLKEIRKKKKIDLEDISRRTRLSIEKLKDIEAGNLHHFSKGYDRIFLKRYLKEIGEDKKEVWDDFNLFFGDEFQNIYHAESTAENSDKNQEQTDLRDKEEDPTKPTILNQWLLKYNIDKIRRYFLITITLIVFGVVSYFSYQQFIFVKKNQLPIKEITVADYIEKMQKEDSLTALSLPNRPFRGYGERSLVKVELKALERTWIREISDERDTTDYILPAGMTRKINATRTINLMLGRADGVEVWLNGQNLGTMGKADEIVTHLVLNSQGVAEKRIKKVITKETTDTENVSPSEQNRDGNGRLNIN
jgi:transcriptional regulator with XRE-family HTH domain